MPLINIIMPLFINKNNLYFLQIRLTKVSNAHVQTILYHLQNSTKQQILGLLGFL